MDKLDMAMEPKFGLTKPNMKDSGRKIRLMDRELSTTIMGIYMKAFGSKVKPMVMESTKTGQPDRNTKGSSKTGKDKVQVSRLWLMEATTKVVLKMVKETVKESTNL